MDHVVDEDVGNPVIFVLFTQGGDVFFDGCLFFVPEQGPHVLYQGVSEEAAPQPERVLTEDGAENWFQFIEVLEHRGTAFEEHFQVAG